MFSTGFKYQWAIRIKDFGERIGHFNVFGFHFLNWLASPIIGLGLRTRDKVLGYTIVLDEAA